MDDGLCVYFGRRVLVPFWALAYTVSKTQGNGCKTWERKQ
jgi:hypothetical protein